MGPSSHLSLLSPDHEYVPVGPASHSGVVLGRPAAGSERSGARGWFQADICSICSRPSLISALLVGRDPHPIPQSIPSCPCFPRGTSITAGVAALCSSGSGAQPAERVFEFPALGAPLCFPPEAPPVAREPRGGQCLRDSSGVSKLEMTTPLDSQLVILSVNAGGLAHKLHKLMPLLFHVEPDVVLV